MGNYDNYMKISLIKEKLTFVRQILTLVTKIQTFPGARLCFPGDSEETKNFPFEEPSHQGKIPMKKWDISKKSF